MNYRTHISVPSSNRVEVSVTGHPELSRLIELPRDAPREWLAHAYLLSIGMDPEAQRLDELEPPISWSYDEWDPHYGPRATYAPVSQERMRLRGVAEEIELTQRGDFQPKVGDQKVAVFPAEQSIAPDRSAAAWQTSPPPFRPDAVNHELARTYGVVLPHFNASALAPGPYPYGRKPLIDSLLAELSSVRRIALRAHLDDIGLFDEADSLDDDAIRQAAEPLLRLLAGIGPDGAVQDPDTGWLPAEFASELASGLGWDLDGTADAAPGALLIDVARKAKLIRRLRGRIVATAAARKLVADPAHELMNALSLVLDTDGYGYHVYDFSPRAASAAALLALADGSARELDDLAGIVELAVSARQHNRDDEYEDEYRGMRSYGHGGSTSAAVVVAAVDSVQQTFRTLSGPGAFAEISVPMRVVARAMLL
ncbi:MAG: hypothetical protein WBA87_06680 [Microbacterium sp.]